MNKDKELMRILKVSELRYLIANTNNGELNKVLRFNEDEYFYTLDSVPLEKEKAEAIEKLYVKIPN